MTEPLAFAKDDDDSACTYTLYSFKDYDTVMEMIASLHSISKDNLQCERVIERLIVIIDRYQEQPHLLDPHLGTLFTKILDPIIEDEQCSAECIHLSFSFLHPLIKVRGYKRATRYLPHDVCNLERVLSLLEKQDKDNVATWATRYCLLLWLSVVAIVPFDLERFARSEGGSGKFLLRLIEIGKIYLFSSDICQQASATYLSKLFDRFDTKKDGLAAFIEWACERMQSQADFKGDLPARILYGLLRVLGLLFKHGARNDLTPYVPKVFDLILSLKFLTSQDILIRKLYCKLLQRLCLVFMKKTVQNWRYERGRRVLATGNAASLGHSDENHAAGSEETTKNTIADVLDSKTLPILERTIAQMIAGLGDKDGVVRWSAAKGLARICARLPVEMAEQVIKTVLGLFSVRLSAGGWHGAALVLAEFARRGLLRESMLINVVPLVCKALFYDEMQGSFALGAHVRDAACYVCWAFARAYRPADLAPFIQQLGSDLVIAMLFDREVQVRRAAAAAFQENVGRQGTFRLGIDILSICDYFSVASIRTCYLELAPAVASLGGSFEYLEPFFNHLVAVKLGHWDAEVRDLASKSLSKLLHSSRSDEENSSLVKSLLYELNTTNDQNRAHGVLSALGESLPNLQLMEQNNLQKLFLDFFVNLNEKPICKGMKGEIVRQAVCRLIASACRSRLTLSSELINIWLKLISDYFRELDPALQDSAASAVSVLLTRALQLKKEEACLVNIVIDSWIEESKTSSFQHTRRGFLKGVAQLPLELMSPRKDNVTDLLVFCCSKTETTLFWTDSRVASLQAISSAFETLDFADFSTQLVDLLIGSCLVCLEDYTSDERGDVAACVREQSAQALMLVLRTTAKRKHPVSEEQVRKVMSSLAGQSCEKISRTRLNAIHCLLGIIRHEDSANLAIPNRAELTTIFAKLPLPPPAAVICSAMPEWSESETFNRFAKLLHFQDYRESVLRGLLLSCGDLTESLSQAAFQALSNHIITLDSEGIRKMFATIFSLLSDAQKTQETLARLATPIVKSIDRLITGGCFDEILEKQSVDSNDELLTKLYEILSKLSRGKNFQRVHAVSKLLCSLLALPVGCPLSKHPATKLIIVLLVHPYPRVRSQTASALFEAISLSPPDDCDITAVTQLLADTDWSNQGVSTKAHADLCKLIDVAPGKILK